MDKSTFGTIDYDAVHRELSKPIANSTRQSHASKMGLSASAVLREFRTVWMGGSRQTGKTTWCLGQLEPHTFMVTVNLNHRRTLIRNLPDHLHGNVFTAADVRNLQRDGDHLGREDIRHVIVDDASFVLERINRNRLYEWIAGISGGKALVTMVTL